MLGHVIERRGFVFDETRNELNAVKVTANKLVNHLSEIQAFQDQTDQSMFDLEFISYLAKITQTTPQLLATIGYAGVGAFIGNSVLI